ncbi:MAG: hypothetical protein D8M59_08200 [Planctomycetes bacterium]|nr:hypothetical protein [Planctomycetota bacterium]NOG53306.1 hypothetical protein [Planctomycetota bacterium]
MIHSNAQLHLKRLFAATHLTLMAAIILPALPALGDDYAIIPIERDNEWSSAIAINNLSQTGGAMQGTFYGEPFLWDRGKYTLLGNMGPTGAGVFDVADSGFATGYYKDQMWLETPFAWEPRLREVHILPFIDGYDSAEAYGVNSAGIVAGTAGNAVAVVWTDGVPDTLPGIGGWGEGARDINEAGWIVGWAADDQLVTNPVLWTDRNTAQDLGTLGEWWSSGKAYAVSDSGQIAGYSRAPLDEHAFLWQDGEMFDLHDHPWLASYANGIGNNGEVVGVLIESDYDPEVTAFLWRDGDGMLELRNMLPPKSNWTNLRQALDINDFGQIVGYGYRSDRNNYNHGFLMTSVYPTFTLDQPTPGTAGEVNTITARNLTPGSKVYFIYGMVGGGSIIPRCEIVEAALQIDDPVIAGTATADANGVATLVGKVPSKWAGKEVLIQGLVSSECDISNLVVVKFE